MGLWRKRRSKRLPDEPPTALEDVTLDVIIEKCGRRGMAWKDTQTFVGFLAKRIKALESRQ